MVGARLDVDPLSMQASQSYPSPTAAQIGEGVGPFFANQQRLSPPDHLHLSAAPLARNALDEGPDVVTGAPHDHTVVGGHPTSPSQLARAGLDPVHDPAFGDPTAPRKRSKVSRACDECRRKKIRCDATSESGLEQCSSCKRVGTRCQFSRVPMKRGPSKGYIKELADRLNTLENSIQPNPHADLQYAAVSAGATSPRPSDGFSPPPPHGSSSFRKRTHSVSDGLQTNYMQSLPQRTTSERLPSIGGWTPESGRHLPHPADLSSSFRAPYTVNGIAQPFWRQGAPEMGRRASVNMPYEATDPRPGELNSDTILEWDEKTIDEYYRIIHPCFPLLAHDKARLRSRLANCPVTAREAFLEALDAAVRSFPSSNLPPTRDFQSTKKAADLIFQSQYESIATRTFSTSLIYLQTLLLMVLEADNHGPATMRGQLGPPRAVWIGSAVGLAYNMRLHTIRCRTEGDADTDEKIARRNWWNLVILDRWHACSTSSPLFISDTNVVLLPEDQWLLGDSTFHLTRLSCIIGHLAEIFVAAEETLAPSSSSAPLIGKLLNGEIERFRESIDPVIGSLNLVNLCYWHVRLLMKRHSPTSEPLDLLAPAERMAAILNSNTTTITPLNHHFAALATLTLVQLADIPETSRGAWKGIEDLHEALDKRRGFSAREDSTGWDSAIRDLILKKKHQKQTGGSGPLANHAGLQHLADLAVSGTGTGSAAAERNTGASSATNNGGGVGLGLTGEGSSGAVTNNGTTTTNAAAPPLPSGGGPASTTGSTTSTGTPALATRGKETRASTSSNGSVILDAPFDPTRLTRYGYLTALVQDGR
ncbi:hypothetical protein L228DRAFT_248804 [Xylona heveae TC161]|uniref:Zn(2)-C6 fungal-type domain-containing protein n=1 Tax=Xylona heveae (strain CBS 132557 / TC161) TaxID=1328760 RepID=A0A165FJG9_XYLHT|nr:hypothetical protein L228DRAFT_248804 [Xylona heveae TC161]KZF21047.1 hypothetical protein L228DRAFT_248804 [Xylona heveae TC161]